MILRELHFGARVIEAEKVEKADKLLKLHLDVGNEERTVVSGIMSAGGSRGASRSISGQPQTGRDCFSGHDFGRRRRRGNLVLVEPSGDIAVGAEVR